MWLLYYFYFERKYGVLKLKSPYFLLNKNINFDKNENWKWKNTHTVLKRWTLRFSWYKNCQLKVKLWWVGARERKRNCIFWKAFYSTEFFKYFCFVSMYSVLNKLSEYITYTFKYQKALPHTLLFCCLFLKSSKSLQCILKQSQFWELYEKSRL